jgi:chemotaxis protein MotB
MAGNRDNKGSGRGIVIIKRNEIVEGRAHHGGAWKVAYADFVTAMMAFFLLMWLLNATTEAQRKGLADYFSPNNLLSHSSSGTGQPFGGHTAFDEGALVSDRGTVEITEGRHAPLEAADDSEAQVFTKARKAAGDKTAGAAADTPDAALNDPSPGGQTPRDAGNAKDGSREPTKSEIEAEKERQEKAAFEKAANEIREAVRSDPALAELGKQLAIDMTPEGLRIQIMDEVKLPMFASGSAVPNDRARELLQKVGPILQKLPEAISIAGYTDATPYAGAGKTNWELSSERANATRRLLTDGGLGETRIRTVTGHADRDPLLPGDPLAAANRRIAIVVLRDTPAAPQAVSPLGAPQAVSPLGAPQGVSPLGAPQRATQGVTQGATQGVTQVVTQRIPQGVTQGMIALGMPRGVPALGVPRGMTQGTPQGAVEGVLPGTPPGPPIAEPAH